MKKLYLGVDRAGSTADFPVSISVVRTHNYQNFYTVMKKVKDIASKRRKLFLMKREIKSKNIKGYNNQKIILTLLIKNNIDFYCILIKKEIYLYCRQLIIKKFKWDKKLEAIFWYKAISHFCDDESELSIYTDMDYTDKGDLILFKTTLLRLIEKNHDNKTIIYSRDSKEDNSIQISDIVSGFFRTNPLLRNEFKNKFNLLGEKDIIKEINQIIKVPPSTHRSLHRQVNYTCQDKENKV